MAETQVALAENTEATTPEQASEAKSRQPLSRPVFKQTLKVNSLQAQRVMERSFSRVRNSLFSIDVILRIIGDQEEIDQVEEIILGHITKVSEDLDQAASRLNKLLEDNGIEALPDYSNPVEYEIEITSPQVAQFARLVQKLDNLMGLVDTLWLNSVLTSQQRTDANHEWQQRLINLAGRIIGIEKRARISAHTKGKENEVKASAPEQSEEDAELKAASEEASKIEEETQQA